MNMIPTAEVLRSVAVGRLAAVLTLLAACAEPNPNLVADDETSGTGEEGATTTSGGTASTPTGGSTTTSDPTPSTTAVESTGDDDDDDETTEEQPVCYRDSHMCVELPPEGWSGPITIVAGSPGDPQPSCGNDYPTHEFTAFDDLSAPPAVCSCSCNSPANVTCTTVQLRRWNTNDCSGTATNTVTVSGCTNMSGSSGRWGVRGLLPAGVSCTPNPSSNVPDASFLERFTACGGTEEIGGCDQGKACVPQPSPETDDRVCIYASGDVACPGNSEYSNRSVYYDDYTDSRGCTNCTCGSPTGQCSGTVNLTDGPCLGEISQQQTVGACTNVTFAPASASSWSQSGFTATCASSGGNPTGSAAPIDPVTVCCR